MLVSVPGAGGVAVPVAVSDVPTVGLVGWGGGTSGFPGGVWLTGRLASGPLPALGAAEADDEAAMMAKPAMAIGMMIRMCLALSG